MLVNWYNTSHIPGAIYLGYKGFKPQQLAEIPKNSKLVLYCSVGYRSEKIGEQLKELGYSDVHNLFGGIFEWCNKGLPLIDIEGKNTEKIHTYNKKWSKWVDNKRLIKLW